MPQTLLPLIPDGAIQINDIVSVVREDDRWTYFHGAIPTMCLVNGCAFVERPTIGSMMPWGNRFL